MSSFARDLPFGATLIAPGPHALSPVGAGAAAVAVEIEGRAPVPMTRRAEGWFEAEARCGAGARYRYRLADGLAVPDPGRRARRPTTCTGRAWSSIPRAYRWRIPDGAAGRGTRPCSTSCMPAPGRLCRRAARSCRGLAELGITAVELMPVNDFPGQRNWGYDGVLPFAPDRAYGTPDELKALVDAAHGLGLMIFLDVVYNHFGPGRELSRAPTRRASSATTSPRPGARAIDFRRPEVRRFFTENALYWLMEYRFDGLRFDAVHAIAEADWLDEMAAEVRATVEPGRQVHLVLEHDGNVADHLRRGFDAQWNDDGHHVLHVLLTGESEGYYADYAERPAEQLARCLAEGFVYQGEPSAIATASRAARRARDLPPTAFVLFLQNHDQIGNRAVRRPADRAASSPRRSRPRSRCSCSVRRSRCSSWARRTRAARRSCSSPTITASSPMRCAKAGGASSRASRLPRPASRERSPTRTRARPSSAPARGAERARHAGEALYRRAPGVARREHLVPRLAGARAIGAEAIGPAARAGALAAGRWRGPGHRQQSRRASLRGRPPRRAICSSQRAPAPGAGVRDGRLAGPATVAFLEPAQ